jgi:UDP-glucose 4-epimerase
MHKLKVVVTGASGFIGSHLVSYLSTKKNVEVVALSRKQTSYSHLVLDYADSPEGDVLIHLAESNSNESFLTNGKNSLNTIEVLSRKRYRRIIYISSAVLYGDGSSIIHSPKDQIFLNTSYAKEKFFSEKVVLRNSNGTVLRLANVYGPNMSKKSVLSQILEQLPKKVDLEVRDVNAIRDFIWIEDIVQGISVVALNNLNLEKESQIYNLGTGVGTSIGNLARLTLDLSGNSERLIVSQSREFEKSVIVLDYSETHRIFGWKPKTSIESGIKKLLKMTNLVRL